MNMKNFTFFTLLALLLAFTNANAFNHKQFAVILNGPWKFKTGDNLQWAGPGFNDSVWETVDLTAPSGPHDGDVGLGSCRACRG